MQHIHMSDHHPLDEFLITRRLVRMIQKGGPAQRTEEWFKMRNNRVTGSIIDPIITGRTAYTTRERLLLEKSGMPHTFKGNVATRHGTVHENDAIRLFERRTGFMVLEFPLVQHPDHELMAHSPDGIVLRPGQKPALLEVKTPFRRDFEHDTHIHETYVHQVQMGLSCFDVDLAFFVQYRPQGHQGKNELLTIIEVQRDMQWLEKYAPVVETFWAEVEHWRQVGWEKHPKADKLKPSPEPKPMFYDNSDEENAHQANTKQLAMAQQQDQDAAPSSCFVDDDNE